MSLQDFIEFTKKYKYGILSVGVLFALFGAILYFLIPNNYVASGSLFVTRSIDMPNSEDVGVQALAQKEDFADFKYEGYYAQQNAVSYTATLLGLIESDEVKKDVLDELGVSVNNNSLRRFGRAVSAKKKAPQLIQVKVKAGTPEDAVNRWKVLIANVTSLSQKLNDKGDPSVVVMSVSDEPVVKESFNNLYVNISVGFLFGVLIGYFVFAIYDNFPSVSKKSTNKKHS